MTIVKTFCREVGHVRTLHCERFASACLTVRKDSSIEAIENSLNKISECFIVKVSLLRAKKEKQMQ